MLCIECNKKLIPLRKETNYIGNRYVPKEWETRNLHKKCFVERSRREAYTGTKVPVFPPLSFRG